MFLRVDKLQIELPAPKKQDPNAAAALQELLGGKYGEMSTLGNYMFQSFNFRSKTKLRPFYSLVAAITAEELGHVELVSNGVAMLNNGPDKPDGDEGDGGDISDAPFEDMKDIRLAAAFLSNGGGAMPVNSNGMSWNNDIVTTTGNVDRRPAAQLPPRMRRAPAQAAGLRDADRPDRPRGLRLPAGARLGPRPCLRAGAEEDHRRRASRRCCRRRTSRSTTSPSARSTWTRARTAASTPSARTTTRRWPGIWGNGEMALPGDPPGELEVVEGMPEGGKIHQLTGVPSAFTPDYAPEEMFEIAAKLYKKSR